MQATEAAQIASGNATRRAPIRNKPMILATTPQAATMPPIQLELAPAAFALCSLGGNDAFSDAKRSVWEINKNAMSMRIPMASTEAAEANHRSELLCWGSLSALA